MTGLRMTNPSDMTVTSLDPLADWVAAFERAADLEKQAKEKKEEYRAMIAAYLEEQGAEYGSVKGKIRVRWRTIVSNRFNTKKFKAENPEIAAKYTDEATSNRMELIDP